jgi:hypothetical protein
VKYALDTYGESPTTLSCTHDANAWPAELYAGLPAPAPGERVVLWLQNSHPRPIPAGTVRLNRMGDAETRPFERAVPPFATCALDIGALLPEARWPQQLELRAVQRVVRPRYGDRGRRPAAHRPCQRQRTDLAPDPRLPEAGLIGELPCCRRRCRRRAGATWRCRRRCRPVRTSCP